MISSDVSDGSVEYFRRLFGCGDDLYSDPVPSVSALLLFSASAGPGRGGSVTSCNSLGSGKFGNNVDLKGNRGEHPTPLRINGLRGR